MKYLSEWAALMACLGLVLAVGVPSTAQSERSRQRRIIINDDGWVEVPSGERTLENCLNQLFMGTVGTQVDSYFLCVGITDEAAAVTHPDELQVGSSQNLWFPHRKLPESVDQLTRGYLRATRDAGMEIFASFRMNDCHDSNAVQEGGWPGVTYPLKVQRPDLLLGENLQGSNYPHLFEGESTKGLTGYPLESVMSWFFCGFDWAKDEVRQHFLDFILGYCRQYDYDGVELDYVRHPMFFRFGEERQNLDTMTDFVRQVRQGLDAIGQERGKPYLLAARVLFLPEQSHRAGLDVERWLAEGLLDLLVISGGKTPYSPRLKEYIDMAHRYGVPAYPVISDISPGMEGREPTQVRAMASDFWALGADGVYIFNYFGVAEGSEQQKYLQQLGDPDTLRGLDKRYQADTGFCWFPYAYEAVPPQFPIGLIYGTPIEMVVGDDVQEAARQRLLAEMRLQVRVSNVDEGEGIQIVINDTPVPQTNIQRAAPDAFEARVEAPPLRRGINQVVVLPGPGAVARVQNREGTAPLPATVDRVELAVDYRQR